MADICGRHRVHMDAWWGFLFRNIKIISKDSDGSIHGYNKAFGIFKWGYFDVFENGPDSYTFQYSSFFDDIEGTKGKLWYNGKLRATFTLERL